MKKLIEGPIETAGVVDDGNAPAFQSGYVQMDPSGLTSTVTIGDVYLTQDSWIGVTPITTGNGPGHLQVDQQIGAPVTGEWNGGYNKSFTINSSNNDDDRYVQWFIITGVLKQYLGVNPPYPGLIPVS